MYGHLLYMYIRILLLLVCCWYADLLHLYVYSVCSMDYASMRTLSCCIVYGYAMLCHAMPQLTLEESHTKVSYLHY